jgi:hypothetical protein
LPGIASISFRAAFPPPDSGAGIPRYPGMGDIPFIFRFWSSMSPKLFWRGQPFTTLCRLTYGQFENLSPRKALPCSAQGYLLPNNIEVFAPSPDSVPSSVSKPPCRLSLSTPIPSPQSWQDTPSTQSNCKCRGCPYNSPEGFFDLYRKEQDNLERILEGRKSLIILLLLFTF